MRCWVVLVAAACGAKAQAPAPGPVTTSVREGPTPKTQAPTPITTTVREGPTPKVSPVVEGQRPRIDLSAWLPDLHEDLRWPLAGMDHPALEPKFPVARELAIDVAWDELCQRGVHKRVSASQKELLAYLHGWCDVQSRNVDAACARFKPLLGSVTRGMTDAVRQDLANVLVAQGSSDQAEHWLSKHDIRDIHTLDLLAASFAEMGSSADAFAINRRAIDADRGAPEATKCRRLVRQIMLRDRWETLDEQHALERKATGPAPDETCRRLHNKLRCWDDPRIGCRGYFADEQLAQRGLWLLDAYYSWPPLEAAPWFTWWNIADAARLAVPAPGAIELSVTALENSVRAAGQCLPDIRDGLPTILDAIRRDPSHTAFGARLHRLETTCEAARPRSVTSPSAP
ncbi:MAG TPA: hypothetical protein VIV11_22905 [Kofleriaceae bacterium]